MTTPHESTLQRVCPSDELLIALVTIGLSDDEQRAIDLHLDTCDRCLEALDTALHRLRIADEVSTSLPAALRARAAAAAAAPPPPPSVVRVPRLAALPPTEGPPGFRRWLSVSLWPQAMVPVAIAAVAVLAIATQFRLTPTAPRTLTRSITLPPQRVRVTAVQTALRRQPTGHAEVVATLRRGMVVEVGNQERDWRHVTLADGTDGWVEQDALQ